MSLQRNRFSTEFETHFFVFCDLTSLIRHLNGNFGVALVDHGERVLFVVALLQLWRALVNQLMPRGAAPLELDESVFAVLKTLVLEVNLVRELHDLVKSVDEPLL